MDFSAQRKDSSQLSQSLPMPTDREAATPSSLTT